MKKLKVVTLLAAVIASMLFFTGCEQKPGKTESQPAKLKVGLILDVVGRGDGGFNDAAYNGLVTAQKDLGNAIETTLVEPRDVNEQEKGLRTLAQNKMDLIIAMGYSCSEPLAKVAPDYSETKFVLIDNDLPNLKVESNITCVTFKDSEGAFLAGAAAALKSQTGKIGFVGGVDIPVIKNFATGYNAGARYINPKIVVLSSYVATGIEGFNDPATARTLALKQISDGADIIFHAAGVSGTGVFEAVASQNKLAIGADVDQTFTVHEAQRAYVLTSIIKGIDVAIGDVIKRQLEKRLGGGYIELGINDGVQIYAENDINKNMLASIKPQLDEIKNKIAHQDIVVPVNK
ncbi:MAG: BMP family ABC transporter substrate-binding protein [Syntrophomonas sp.]|nr:BMP family ABC transporter substrate-binding protein [Syntrophomonas sp.]